MELGLGLLQLGLVTSDEESCHMVAVWELPWILGLLEPDHVLEVTDHFFGLTSLSESVLEDS